MLRLAWLTTAQHVFQPALTGRLVLVSRKIVSRGPRTKAIAVSKFREKLSPANWIQGVTAISRQISRSWAPKNGVQHATAIYPIPRYTRPRYIGLTLYNDVALFWDKAIQSQDIAHLLPGFAFHFLHLLLLQLFSLELGVDFKQFQGGIITLESNILSC